MQIEQYYSDDYAGLTSGKFKFYYGYEVTDPKDKELWCFQVKEHGNIVFQVNQTEIEKSVKNDRLDSVRDYLIAGIGMWLLLK